VFFVLLQQIVLITGDCVNRNGKEGVGFAVSRLKSGVMELGMRVAGDTANIVCNLCGYSRSF
jgi:hypothetical protein